MSEVRVETNCTREQTQRVCVVGNISVRPKATCAPAEVSCVGTARIITPQQPPCPGGTRSTNGSCHFTLAQELCVAVPVEFAATVACGEAGAYCFPAVEPDPPASPLDSFSFPLSADFYHEHLFPVNFSDAALCQAVRAVCAGSPYLCGLLKDAWNLSPCDPCPAIFPLRTLDRLEALLAPAPDVLGRTTRQLLAVLLNASLGDLRLGRAAADVVTAADAALAAGDEAAAAALEPALAELNTKA